jgi:hypothetical protein
MYPLEVELSFTVISFDSFGHHFFGFIPHPVAEDTLSFFFSAFIYLFIYLFIFVYSYVHTKFGSFLPPTPHLLPLPPTLLLPERNCSAIISNFVEERV